MAIALVQTASGNTSSATSVAAVWSNNTVTGNLIIVTVITSNIAVSSIADSQTNTYTKIDETTGSASLTNSVWYAKNITGGTLPTITATLAGSTQAAIIVREYSGADTTAPFDKKAVATGVAGTVDSTSTATTTQANELVIGAIASSAGTPVAGSGYGNMTTKVALTIIAGMEDKLVSATGTYNATFTGPSSIWVATVATFKEAAATTTASSGTFELMGV